MSEFQMEVEIVEQLQSSRRRVLKDKFAHGAIASSGSLVLITLLLILCYLLYVVSPMITQASVTPSFDNRTLSNGASVYIGMDPAARLAYRVTNEGVVEFYSQAGEHEARTITLPAGVNISGFAVGDDNQHLVALGLANGQLQLVNVGNNLDYRRGKAVSSPQLHYPLSSTPLILDPKGEAISHLAFAFDGEQLTVVWQGSNDDWHLSRFTSQLDPNETVEWRRHDIELALVGANVSKITILPSQQQMFVLADNQVELWDLGQQQAKLTQLLTHRSHHINDIALLAGASSLLVADESGLIVQWFEVRGDDGRKFRAVRQFQLPRPARKLATEPFRKTFAVSDDVGGLTLLYSTSERQLWQQRLGEEPIDVFAFAPNGDGLIVQFGDQVEIFKLDNPHPEISLSSLWQQVWYEGYPKPEYVWQSTSASDHYETKLSIVPLVFGTIKAAFYAMLIALPLAVCGAIYTAFFMSSRMRSMVKPTIELMEALPTVILGFLAGLWLAPIVEDHLAAVMLLAIMLPLSILLTGWSWRKLAEGVRQHSWLQYQELLLIPILLLVGWLCFSLSPLLELWLMDGDGRAYVTNVLGIDYNQRNALVIGIAMGFAVIPTIFTIAEDAIFSVPRHLVNSSLALGATQWQTLTRVVLVIASPGIFSAAMMGFGRAVGETMIVLMATGNTAIMKWNLFEGMRTLAANIAIEIPEAAVASSHYRLLFLTALVLFLFTFFFNTGAELIRQRLRRKYAAL